MVFSIVQKSVVLESAIPSESITRVWSSKKTAFIADEENRIFAVGFTADREMLLKRTFQLSSNVQTFFPLKSANFICGLSLGSYNYLKYKNRRAKTTVFLERTKKLKNTAVFAKISEHQCK